MKTITIRDLRNNPGKVWRLLREEDVALTANGKPIALLVGVEDADLERTAGLIRRARAQAAVARMRSAVTASGRDGLSLPEVNAEIRAARVRRPR